MPETAFCAMKKSKDENTHTATLLVNNTDQLNQLTLNVCCASEPLPFLDRFFKRSSAL